MKGKLAERVMNRQEAGLPIDADLLNTLQGEDVPVQPSIAMFTLPPVNINRVKED
jgi:hypothetical protein